jgi:hypothetical protein
MTSDDDRASAGESPDDRDYWEGLISETEAARFIGLSIRFLQNKRVRGGGPLYVPISRRCVRYRRRDLIAWANERIEAHTSERELQREQASPAGPATSTEVAQKTAARRSEPVTQRTPPAPAQGSPAPVTKPAQAEPASNPPQQRERNPFDPFGLMSS